MPKEKRGNLVISRVKKYKTSVHINFLDEPDKRLIISYETYTNHLLYPKKELSYTEYKDIKRENDLSHEYLKKANELLRHRKSEMEVRNSYYEKGVFKTPDINYLIEKLKKAGYINDNELAEDYLEAYNIRGYGKNKIIEKLREKGINEEIITSLDFPLDIEREKAKKLLPQLLTKYEKYPYLAKKNKVVTALTAKGYSHSIINEVIEGEIKEDEKLVAENLAKDMARAIQSRSHKNLSKKELKQKVYASLLQRGYSYNKINEVWNRNYEND